MDELLRSSGMGFEKTEGTIAPFGIFYQSLMKGISEAVSDITAAAKTQI